MSDECDLAVVGAGIVGLAVARELLTRHPGRSLVVLEREGEVGRHQTGHNSGVIHAGIYYAPGSLKARLCVSGARELYEFCERHGIAARRCGKLIVATTAGELPALEELHRRGEANGVSGLRRLRAEEIADVEPHARGVAALHSPATGVVDFVAVARALAGEVEALGGRIATSRAVEAVAERAGRLRLAHPDGAETAARHAVFCAGAWADRLARGAGAEPEPRIVPFRGAYLRLRPERRELVRAMIYPVPDPRLPFLGVHLTRHFDDEVTIGPSALMVGALDAYRLGRVRARDLADTLLWPGTARLVHRWWRTGVTELRRAASVRSFVADAARYVPELRASDVERGPAGVRAQALARDGTLVEDFAFSHTGRALHVRNAPSPAATSALAIARHVADEAERAFDLDA